MGMRQSVRGLGVLAGSVSAGWMGGAESLEPTEWARKVSDGAGMRR